MPRDGRGGALLSRSATTADKQAGEQTGGHTYTHTLMHTRHLQTQRYIHTYMSLRRWMHTHASGTFAYVCDGALCLGAWVDAGDVVGISRKSFLLASSS